MDTILRLYSQDSSGATLRQYFDEIDSDHNSVDHISTLVLHNLQALGSSLNTSESGDKCLQLVRAILKASPEGDGSNRRSQVLKGSVAWLIQVGEAASDHLGRGASTAAIVDEIAGKLTNTMIDTASTFTQEALVQNISTMTEAVRHQRRPHAQIFALLSRLVLITANADSVTVPDSSEEISGSEYRDIIVDRICTAPWNHKSVLPLATALADINIEGKQLEPVIIKIMKQFKHVDAADLPVLIYNLLLLSSKGHQRLVLKGTLEFFDRLNAGGGMAESLQSDNPKSPARLGFSELSAIESTVILHFSFAVKQDQELGTELLKHMKSGKTAYISSFSLTCLMTMARIHRFEDNVMDYLKSTISSVFKDTERMQREPWVLDFEGMSPVSIFGIFNNIIQKIPFGLEQLTPSLVHCGVYIMDSMAPKTHWAVSDSRLPRKMSPKSPGDLGCELGTNILAEIFRTQASARTEILDHIMSRIVTKSTSTTYFLQLLEAIVKDSPDALEEHLPRVKESLDYLSFLPLATAVCLMAAIKDIAKSNRSFRDSLILILRKALFSKTLESRQVALSGFLLLLGPASKPQMSLLSGSSKAGAYRSLEAELPVYSMEILGMLRRCLGQQGEVRLALYVGLMELVETAPYLSPIIFEILQAHFIHFYDKTGTRLTPLKLEECIGNSKTGGEPIFIEPLQYLMTGIVRSLVGLQRLNRRSTKVHDEVYADEQQVSDCHRDLDTILLGLQRAGLEDFELDKTSDFNMGSNIGARNNMYATLLTGCYESAIEYTVLKQSLSAEASSTHGKSVVRDRDGRLDPQQRSLKLPKGSAEVILVLFGKIHKLFDIVKEKVIMSRGKKMGPLGESSVLGLEAVTKLIEFMFIEQSDEGRLDEEALRLRANEDFVYYITTVVYVLLHKLYTSAETLTDNEYDYCRRLSRVLVREFLVSERPDGPKAVAAGAKGKDKNKSLLMVGIEALTSGLLVVQRFYSREPIAASDGVQSDKIVSSFLAATLPQANGGLRPDQSAEEVVAWTTSCTLQHDTGSLASAYIHYLQGLVVMFVNETIPLLKEAAGLLNIIQLLSKYLLRISEKDVEEASDSDLYRVSSVVSSEIAVTGSNQLDKLIHWIAKLCRDQALDDASLTKTLLSMMLQLEQESVNPQMTADLFPSTQMGTLGEASSFGFGSLTASSAVAFRPEAAARLRLAADVMLTYGLNYGGPDVPTFRDLPDRAPQGEQIDEDVAKLIQLRREVGIETCFAVVTLRTSGAITEVLLHQVDRSLEGLEWAISKLRYCGLAYSGSDNLITKQSAIVDHDMQQYQSSARPRMDIAETSTSSSFGVHASCPKKSFTEFETEICWRIEICLWILVRISQSCINQSSSEHLMRVLQRSYRVLAALTKYFLTPPNAAPLNLFSPLSSSTSALKSNGNNQRKGATGNSVIQLPHGFLRVTQVAGMELSRYLYSFLSYFQMLDVEQQTRAQERNVASGQKGPKKNGGGKKGKNVDDDNGASQKNAGGRAENTTSTSGGFKARQKAKILRESKLIPTLIYAVEQYERYVIQLSKKAKVNLTQFMRRSTARDFRIQIQRLGDLGLEDKYEEEQQQRLLQRQLEQQQQNDEEMVMAAHHEEDDDEEETLLRSRKRIKHEV
ncbi:hypothetical protein BX616_000765 [Lobosporangium transversale]|uniref:FANCI solenoid 2-domain-containing protein n=1 Tax=Lobosporangium transversale TaxID=64571 RepID=A0A1Y2H1P1_9FUNG|nr:FANCI solenoid 2-domain-containing protein [Lobosporangium transversale]KAF9917506.1 hypothetical protein BX616_000765 [Lobosporangium transversale]ORZ26962.1 FANCI solenoid 2-domain-containing protein [Lobosporangium transversale]|eukprot:XP_021884709.1 FANCI solenoid 2-domain-containing protein [Lobosporangium transversale]